MWSDDVSAENCIGLFAMVGWLLLGAAVVLAMAVGGYLLDRKLLISHDLSRFGAMTGAVLYANYLIKWRQALVPDVFEQVVDQYGANDCVVTLRQDANHPKGEVHHHHASSTPPTDTDTWSFDQLDRAANRVANWAIHQKKLQPRDNVVLLMENRVEFLIVWLGLMKVGVVTACVNTHIRHEALAHCLRVADARVAIVGVELIHAVQDIADQFAEISFVVFGQAIKEECDQDLQQPEQEQEEDLLCVNKQCNGYTLDCPRLERELEAMSTTRPDASLRRSCTKPRDPLMLIYTSGTTGFPKAARFSHSTFLTRAIGFGTTIQATSKDRLFCALPLYHATGGNMVAGMMMCRGASLCLARKFSANKFFHQVRAMDCTVVSYIGEMCTYLVKSPPRPNDGQGHRVRLAFGNGLRSEIWPVFQQRFNIPAIAEFYGSTEGTVGLANLCWRPDPKDQGHLGKYGLLARRALGMRILRYDSMTQQLVRDLTTGFCVECNPNEVGELVGPVSNHDPLKQFNGYHKNPAASKKKLAHNVFAKGDVFFRSGDLFRMDDEGRFFFVDRVGDTFRWKGENVATTEVTSILNKFDDTAISDLCVYGVQIPGHEGRACMAALVLLEPHKSDAEWLKQFFDQFARFTQQRLASYAVPVFVRLVASLEKTGTQKLCTTTLREDGMDPHKISDPIWYLDHPSKLYAPLTRENYEQVVTCHRF